MLHSRKIGLLTTTLLLLMSFVLGGQSPVQAYNEGDAPVVYAQDDAPAHLAIVRTADGFTLPENVTSGVTTIDFMNENEIPSGLVLMRLNDGVAFTDFTAAATEDPMAALALVSFRGGSLVMPGATVTLTFDLTAGTYLVIDADPEFNIAAMGIIEVVEGEATAVAPEADLTVELVDFAFVFSASELSEGQYTFNITNSGEQWHEMAIIKLPEGLDPADAMEVLMAEPAEGEAPVAPEFILLPMGAGEEVWADVTLSAGNYVVTCFLPDVTSEEGHAHIDMGMISFLTVTEVEDTGLTTETSGTIAVTRTAEGFDMPSYVANGATTITFSNEAEMPSGVVMMRLNDDVEFGDFAAAAAEDPTSALPLVSFRGGSLVMPGAAVSLSFDLTAGTYIVMDADPEFNVTAMGVFEVVADETTDVVLPEADLAVELVDFAFVFSASELSAGDYTLHITNTGEQWHEMVIIKLPEGVDPADAMEVLMAEPAEGEAPSAPDFILLPMGAGEEVWADVTLTAGNYVVTCFLPDVTSEEGHAHIDMGMISFVTVTE